MDPTQKMRVVDDAVRGIFRIRLLKWKGDRQPDRQAYTARVPGGSYTVERWRPDGEAQGPWSGWHLSYHFRDYYDEESEIPCESLASAKAKAWADWVARLLPALVAVRTE